MGNRRNRRRARRPRSNIRTNTSATSRNRRPVVLFRKPPNPGPIPRNTGLSAGGLTTTIAFDINVNGTVSGSINSAGWAALSLSTTEFNFSPNNVLGARPDSIKGLLALYSEFRFNRITVHWIPVIGWAAHGQISFALVDASYGYSNGMTYDDVAVSPNAVQLHVGGRAGRAWVATEPTALDWRGPTVAAAHLIYAADQLFAPIGVAANVRIGRFFVRVDVSLRSPTQATGLTSRLLEAMQL